MKLPSYSFAYFFKKNFLPFFFVIFCIVFLIETAGLPFGRELSFGFICLLSFLLIIIFFIDRNIFFRLKAITICAIFFILSLIGQWLFHLNQSCLGIFFYSGLICSFYIGVTGYTFFEKRLLNFLFFLVAFLPIYSILARNFIYPNIRFLIPDNGFQLIFATFGLHNHIGDYLAILLPIFSYLYFNQHKKIYLIIQILLLPWLLYSYSRTAYFTFLVLTVLVVLKSLKSMSVYSASILSIITLILSIFFVFTIEDLSVETSSSFLGSTKKNLFISDKPLFASRIEYFGQAISSIQEKPFGIGFENFAQAAIDHRYNTPHFATTSHNIFLDVFTEQGVISGVLFLVLMGLMFRYVSINIFSIISIGLFITFQFDYTFKIYAIIWLFFLVTGIYYGQSQKKDHKNN